jgi:hypothetical protein
MKTLGQSRTSSSKRITKAQIIAAMNKLAPSTCNKTLLFLFGLMNRDKQSKKLACVKDFNRLARSEKTVTPKQRLVFIDSYLKETRVA